jgi:hypothetical protein
LSFFHDNNYIIVSEINNEFKAMMLYTTLKVRIYYRKIFI